MTVSTNRIVIMGAAGRDFHNFNIVYRNDPHSNVVAFTAAQIPGIAGRTYPPELAGPLYPQGIPIADEAQLEALCRRHQVQTVVFAYSDVTHETVMHAASRALAAGADFTLLGPDRTMLVSEKPVIAVTAVRTGCGKSQTTRYLSSMFRARGIRVAILRHPMPYGDLSRQQVQRFASLADLDDARCTNEEREEYEPHISMGSIVFAGVDYQEILRRAEREADLILWDGGNNDFSFVRPDLSIVMTDALRPGQSLHYHPGEALLRSASIAVIAKTNAARAEDIATVEAEIREANPFAPIVLAASTVTIDDPAAIRGRRVLVVEDGPTITHGGVPYGAGLSAAKTFGAGEVVDPRLSATPEMLAIYARYPHIGPVLPDMGYSDRDLDALRTTIEGASVDAVLVAAPIDLKSLLHLTKPVVRVRYEYGDNGEPRLSDLVDAFLQERGHLRAIA